MPQADAPMFSGARYAAAAHIEPLPDGTFPKFGPAAERRRWFPIDPIQKAVEGVKGTDYRPVTLTVDERLYSFLPWKAYVAIPVEGAGSLSRWHARRAEVTRLSKISDPGTFASESATTEFGTIDVFVLRKRTDGWQWDNVRFQPGQFSSEHWTIFTDLPEDIVVAVRK
jgi:hypothetical protein